MERFTISLESSLAQAFDALIAQRGYQSRSEAVRDMLRAELEASRQRNDQSEYCIACLSYVYNHHERELAERLAQRLHAEHDLSVATLHTHLDHDHCLESSILRGPTRKVRQLANVIMALSGVRHGGLNLISLARVGEGHQHGNEPLVESHRHFRPIT